MDLRETYNKIAEGCIGVKAKKPGGAEEKVCIEEDYDTVTRDSLAFLLLKR